MNASSLIMHFHVLIFTQLVISLVIEDTYVLVQTPINYQLLYLRKTNDESSKSYTEN